jgi:hypothetical protein
MTTHDYTTPRWGHEAGILTSRADGTVRLSGWGSGLLVGDHVTLPSGTTYRITELKYMLDPRDQWFATGVRVEPTGAA